MSLENEIKNRVPESDNPEPESTLSAADFGSDSTSDTDPEAETGEQGEDSQNTGERQERADSQDDPQTDNTASPDPDGQDPTPDADGAGKDAQQSLSNYDGGDNWPPESNSGATNQDPDNGSEPDPDSEPQGGSGSPPSEESNETPDSDTAPGGQSTESDGPGDDTDTGTNTNPDNPSQPPNSDPLPPVPDSDNDTDGTLDSDLIERQKSRMEGEKQKFQQEQKTSKKELERFINSLQPGGDNSGNSELAEMEFNIHPNRATEDSSRWTQAMKAKNKTARTLKMKLKRDRRDSVRYGQRKGRIDSRRLHGTRTKSLNMMKQRKEGNNKKYSVIMVLDRSGSMTQQDITIAEDALTRYALAMEDIDIRVCVMDMFQSTPRIICPFGTDISAAKGDILTKKTGGSTPLSGVIRVARKRMETADDTPMLISITDGRPDSKRKYLDELEQCEMPVMGITIGNGDSSSAEEFYDVHTSVTSESELTTQLERMTSQITF